jgi:Transposase DDE domain
MLVESHLRAAPELAAGVASLPGTGSAFAATQGAWRFLNNERVKLSALIKPLRETGRSRAAGSQACFALLVHDWCKLSYPAGSKRDLVQLTHETDVGYELTSALLVSADDGNPLAPMEMHVRMANGVLSTRDPAPRVRPHLEQALPTMEASRTWGLSKLLVHVIDREADSVDHYRRWDAKGHKFLIRADDRRVKWNGQPILLSEIRRRLRRRQEFRRVGAASHHGRPAELWVVETDVVLYRPAKKNVRGKKYARPGPPLALRYIIVQLRDARGKVLAEWMLLSNVPRGWATTEHLARCYYWRWKIESFFKLLKSHGLQLEQWQQETGPAIARRLLIAAMACVVVWQLQADDSPEATEFKNVLVRLSGRQMKRARPHTAPALLAGLWILLSMCALLQHYDLRYIKRLAARMPFRDTG